MKNIILFICLVVSFQMFGQVPTGFQYRRVNERIQGKFMVDSMGYMARYYDTTAANLHMLIDTCGAHFFSYATNTVWVRACNPKHWVEVGSGGGIGTLDTLLPRDAMFDVVQNTGGTAYKSHRQIVYNIKDYGATGDGVTDDQPFIQRAIDSCFSQGGGVVYLPNGIYLLTATAQSGMHLRIPVSTIHRTDTAVTVEFRGETPPMMWTNPLTDTNNAKPPLTGVILKSSLLSSTAIISTNFDGAGQANFCNVVIKNIGFRVRSMTGLTHVAPEGQGIDGSKLSMLTVDNVRIDTESPRDSTVMPNSSSVGINFPRVNNWCQINFTNSLITGVYKAVVVAEHFKANNVELDGNYIGLTTYGETQYHPIEISQMGFWRNAYNIVLQGSGRISITHAVFEDDTVGTPWFENIADIDEGTPSTWSGAIGFAKNYSFAGPSDAVVRLNSSNSYLTTYPFVNPLETTGYGHALIKNLGQADQANLDLQSTGHVGVMRIGQISSTYAGFLDLAANDGYLSAGNGNMMLETAGTKIKVGIGSFGQTHEISSIGFKYASSTYGAFLGIGGPAFPGVWLKTAADAPSTSNYTLAESSSLTLLSGPSGIHFEVGNDITNGLILDASKRLGFGAYNFTPTASLHLRVGNSSASGAPLKFTTGSAALLATPEAGAIEVLVDSLYYTGNSGTRYKIYPQSGSTPTLQQVTDIGNTTDTLIKADAFNVTRSATSYAELAIGSFSGFLHGALNLRSPNSSEIVSIFPTLGLTASRTQKLQDADGVIALKGTLSKGVFVAFPTSADTVDVWQTPVAITITSLKAILRGTSPSVTYNIAFGTNIQSPTAVFTSDITCTSFTTGCSNSSGFNDATIPAGSFIWVYTTATSGTIRAIAFTINYTED